MQRQGIRSNNEIGAWIRRRRLELSLSQEELAEELEVSRQQVQRYESGKDTLNVERLQFLCDVLSVPADYFFRSAEGVAEGMEGQEQLLYYFNGIPDMERKELVVVFARSLCHVG